MILWDTTQTEILGRLLLALGLVIGWNRRCKGAGLRTFSLVCLGSAGFTAIGSVIITGESGARILAQLPVAIGFIGAGIIWKESDKFVGLTTAASIWVTAVIGMLMGIGYPLLAGLLTLLTVFILLLNRIFPKSQMCKLEQ